MSSVTRPQSKKDWASICAVVIALVGGGYAAKNILFSGAATTAVARAENKAIDDINKQRRAHGLKALVIDTSLRSAARAHSSNMIKLGYFAHDGADGTFINRLRRFVGRRSLVGENIALEPNLTRNVVKDWMNSPPHKHIILLKDLRRVGVGYVTGKYHNRNSAMVTADFSS